MTCSCLKAISLLIVAFTSRAVIPLALTQLLSRLPAGGFNDPCQFPRPIVAMVNSMVLTPVAPISRSDASTVTSMGNIDLRTEVPEGKTMAVVLRGETFRYAYRDSSGHQHRKPCAEEAKSVQLLCTHSLITKVIEPLERKGNRFEIFFTTVVPDRARMPLLQEPNVNSTSNIGDCSLDNLIVSAFQANPNRVVKRRSFSTTGQADTMLKVTGGFGDEYSSVGGVSAKFDFVMIVRSDLHWYKAIDQISVDFGKVNVLSRCKPAAPKWAGGPNCVHDSFWMMPGSLYSAFISCFGKPMCFDKRQDPINGFGHGCQKPIRAAIAKAGHPDAFGWLEEAQRRVRPKGHYHPEPWGRVADLVWMPSQ